MTAVLAVLSGAGVIVSDKIPFNAGDKTASDNREWSWAILAWENTSFGDIQLLEIADREPSDQVRKLINHQFSSVLGFLEWNLEKAENLSEPGFKEDFGSFLSYFLKISAKNFGSINADSEFNLVVSPELNSLSVKNTAFNLNNPADTQMVLAILKNRYEMNKLLEEVGVWARQGKNFQSRLEEEQGILRLKNSRVEIVFAAENLRLYSSEHFARVGDFFQILRDRGYPLPRTVIIGPPVLENNNFRGLHLNIGGFKGNLLVSSDFELNEVVHEAGHSSLEDLEGEVGLRAFKDLLSSMGGNNRLSYVNDYARLNGEAGLANEDFASTIEVYFTNPAEFRAKIKELEDLGTEETRHAAEVLRAKWDFCAKVFGR